MVASNVYRATERLYLDKDGKVVKADDPSRLTLLVGVGGELPMARAGALGLTSEPAAPAQTAAERKPGPNDPESAYPDGDGEAEAKAVDAPPSNKARRAAPDTK